MKRHERQRRLGVRPFDDWHWLAGTFWVVPESNLTAALFVSDRDDPGWLSDQTVWQITGYANGYFWGNTAVQMLPPGSSGHSQAPAPQRLTASITPEGNLHMTFTPLGSMSQTGAVVGVGHMRRRDGAWVAEMQMSAPFGTDGLTLHWACMAQSKPGDASWEKLPGTDQSLPEFMKAAGFIKWRIGEAF